MVVLSTPSPGDRCQASTPAETGPPQVGSDTFHRDGLICQSVCLWGETGPGVTLQGRVTLSLLQVTVLPLLTVKTQEHQSHLTADAPHSFVRRGPGGRRVGSG